MRLLTKLKVLCNMCERWSSKISFSFLSQERNVLKYFEKAPGKRHEILRTREMSTVLGFKSQQSFIMFAKHSSREKYILRNRLLDKFYKKI